MRAASFLEFLALWARFHEVEVPAMHLMQIGKTALGECPQQVQGRGGLMIGVQHPRRVRLAASGLKAISLMMSPR